ncbi:unnamed protein product, partial [Porites lobata]
YFKNKAFAILGEAYFMLHKCRHSNKAALESEASREQEDVEQSYAKEQIGVKPDTSGAGPVAAVYAVVQQLLGTKPCMQLSPLWQQGPIYIRTIKKLRLSESSNDVEDEDDKDTEEP